MPRTALLICNGEPPSGELARRLARKTSLLVAADGGANTCRHVGLRPDIIVGDLDSAARDTLQAFPSSEIIRVARQDNTDLEKALDLLVSLGRQSVVILGATGRRLDFTLGNLSVLWRYTRRLQITVAGDGWFALPVVRGCRVKARRGTRVSIVPFGSSSGITLRGLKYPLTNARMTIGEIGVSNVTVRSAFSVRVRRGKLLLIVFQSVTSL